MGFILAKNKDLYFYRDGRDVIEIQNSVNFHQDFFAKEKGKKRFMNFDFWFFNHSNLNCDVSDQSDCNYDYTYSCIHHVNMIS